MARFLRPGTALRTASITAANPSSSARRSHMITNAFIFGVAPSSGGSGWISQIAQDGRHFTDRGAVLQYQRGNDAARIDRSIGVEELLLRSEIDGHDRHRDAFLREKDSYPA